MLRLDVIEAKNWKKYATPPPTTTTKQDELTRRASPPAILSLAAPPRPRYYLLGQNTRSLMRGQRVQFKVGPPAEGGLTGKGEG